MRVSWEFRWHLFTQRARQPVFFNSSLRLKEFPQVWTDCCHQVPDAASDSLRSVSSITSASPTDPTVFFKYVLNRRFIFAGLRSLTARETDSQVLLESLNKLCKRSVLAYLSEW